MATPIINTNLGKVVTATGNIADDLSTLRPLLRNMLFNAYATDKVENTPIASFPDGADNVPVKSATFAIQPVQDLHGYDSPWPAGGGKNKLPLTLADIRSANTSGTWSGNAYTNVGVTFTVQTDSDGNITGINVNGTATGTTNFNLAGAVEEGNYILNGCPTGGSSTTYRLVADYSGGSVVDTGSGVTISNRALTSAYIRITNGTTISNQVFKPMLRLSTEADATFAPYSNECPITGFTGAEITAKGTNLWDEEWEVGYINNDTGGNISDATRIRSKNYIPVVGGVANFFKIGYSPAVLRFAYYDAYKQYLGADAGWKVGYANSSFTPPQKARFMRFTCTGTTYNHDISINYPSTDTAYHASVGATKDIAWQDEAGTVYGGTLQYLGGDAWRLTKTMESVDLGTLNWTYSSGVMLCTSNIGATSTNGICSIYTPTTASASNMPNCSFRMIGWQYNNSIWVKDNAYSDAATFKAAVTGQQLVYELATPVTYDLTGEELATVLGNNNVFSNTGDVTELVYRADTALFVEKKLAE